MDGSPSDIEAMKQQARRLRAALEADGRPVGHGRSLELLARQYGYKDWNTLRAVIGSRSVQGPVATGARVSGRYLGQPFRGEVIGVMVLAPPGRFRITIQFDEPVDVVTFDSFSAFRHRVTCVVDQSGISAERTSDGTPHMRLQV